MKSAKADSIGRSDVQKNNTGSSNGRTPGFGPGYLGSSPSPVAFTPHPFEVVIAEYCTTSRRSQSSQDIVLACSDAFGLSHGLCWLEGIRLA